MDILSTFVIRVTLIDPNGNEVVLNELQRSPEDVLLALVPQLGTKYTKVNFKDLIDGMSNHDLDL